MLIRLIYASTVRDGVDLNELKRILQQSQANNHRRDMTGVLAFNSKIVLQALEGSRDQINELYTKLLRDDRHHTVVMLKYQEVQERQWAGWSMGFAAPSGDARSVFLKYSQHSTFNPYTMGGDAVEKMLNELSGKTIAMTVSESAFMPAQRPAAVMPPIVPRPAAPAAVSTAVPQGRPQMPVPPVRPQAAAPIAPAAPKAAETQPGLLGRMIGR